VWPFAAVVITRGWLQILNALVVGTILMVFAPTPAASACDARMPSSIRWQF
jgi:hypothetical protein